MTEGWMPNQAGHDRKRQSPLRFSPSSLRFSLSSLRTRGSRALAFSLLILKENDTGSSITNVEDDRRRTPNNPGCPIRPGMTGRGRCLGACGRGCAPVPSMPYGGEDCLSAASSAAQVTGTGAQAPPLGGHARAPMVLGPFAETKGPRRVGAKPRMQPQDPGCPIGACP